MSGATKVVLRWYDTETGELIGRPQDTTLRRYKDENPNAPSQRVILDEMRVCGKYTLTNQSVRLEMTRAFPSRGGRLPNQPKRRRNV